MSGENWDKIVFLESHERKLDDLFRDAKRNGDWKLQKKIIDLQKDLHTELARENMLFYTGDTY